MSEQRVVELSDLLTEPQLTAVQRIITEIKLKQTSPESLRIYLRSISKELELKQVDSSYLYYALCYKVGLK